MLAGVGDEQEEVRHPVSDGSSGLCSCLREAQRWTAPSSAAQATGGRRVATHSPVRAATLVVNRWARSALSAAVVPVRPPHRGPAPLRQDRPGLAGEPH